MAALFLLPSLPSHHLTRSTAHPFLHILIGNRRPGALGLAQEMGTEQLLLQVPATRMSHK